MPHHNTVPLADQMALGKGLVHLVDNTTATSTILATHTVQKLLTEAQRQDEQRCQLNQLFATYKLEEILASRIPHISLNRVQASLRTSNL